jgi:hypothetical protein
MASGVDPPRPSAGAHPFREIITVELGHSHAMVAGLNFEPDAIGERDDALGATGVFLFGHRLGNSG